MWLKLLLVLILNWLRGVLRLPVTPVTHLGVTLMSKNAVVTWIDPTQTGLTGLELAIQVLPDTGTPPPFTVLQASIAPGAQIASIPDLVDGNYAVRVTALYGTNRSPGVSVSFSVATVVTPPPTTFQDVSGLAVSVS